MGEEEGRRALRHQDAVRRPRCGLRQGQDVPRGGDEGALGYIKKNKLNKGRTITPDAKLKKVLPSNSLSMFKMPGMLKKHIKLVRGREHEASQSHAQRSSST